jgi:hypothetical protein
MRNSLFGLCIAASLPFCPALANTTDEFYAAVEARGEIYTDIQAAEESATLALEGRLGELDAQLLAAVPDKQKSVADFFILANMFYSNHPEQSYALMERAFTLAPDLPPVQYEMAMQEHRAGNCQRAYPLYEEYFLTEAGRSNEPGLALLADCYLRTGQLSAAIAAWNGANHPRNHVSIEKAIHAIYGDQSPLAIRNQLLQDIETGDLRKLGRLIETDLIWRTDWWNVRTHDDYLDHDLALAARLLGEDDPRYKELLLLVLIVEGGIANAEEFVSTLRQTGLWRKEGPLLPWFPSTNLYSMITMQDLDVASNDLLLARYESPLRKRALRVAADQHDLDTLAFLYAQLQSEKLAEVDRFGWENLHLDNYAASYVAGIAADSPDYLPALKQAYTEFPDNPLLAGLMFEQFGDTDARDEYLAALVAAEFPNVKNEGNSYRLKALFGALADEMD